MSIFKMIAIFLLCMIVLVACGGSSDPTAVPPTRTQAPPAAITTPLPTTLPTGNPIDNWTRPADGMEMVLVPARTFLMGSTEAEVDEALSLCQQYPDPYNKCQLENFSVESPQHSVTLGEFWIDRTEVTNAQYALCVADGACIESRLANDPTYYGDDYPVAGLPWQQAADYCAWAGGRLPTEAEWEYAARGPENLAYPWGNQFDCSGGNFMDDMTGCADSYAKPAPVGSFPAGVSWCGALDMAGNVWEWTADFFAPYSTEAQTNPNGPAFGDQHILRGGSWGYHPPFVRASFRYPVPPTADYLAVGFRCALDAMDHQAPPAGAAGKLVFYSERDGNAELYTMKADGSDPHRLTFNQYEDVAPVWSPDGGQIAFISNRNDPQAGSCFPHCLFQLYLINADGSDEHQLIETEFSTHHPDWHPDGTMLSFDSEVNLQGDLYVLNADGGELQLLIPDGFWADWSPDGSQIAFASGRDGNLEIYVADADGSNPRRLTNNQRLDFFPAWSPDGERIAFATLENRKMRIYVMNADGSEEQLLTEGDRLGEDPTWAPDGAQLAFQSDMDGNFEIYLMNADGSNLQRLTENGAGDYWPNWTPLPAATQTPHRPILSPENASQIEKLATLSGHNDRVLALAFSQDTVASVGRDGTLRLWDAISGEEEQVYTNVNSEMNGVTFSPDGLLLATSEQIWDLISGQVLLTMGGGFGPVAFSPDGGWLAVGGVGKSIELWELASGQVLHNLQGHPLNDAFSVAFSPDGTLLAAGGHEGTATVWNIASEEIVHAFQHNSGYDYVDIHDVAFSPDGSLLASAGIDMQVNLWDLTSGDLVRSLSHWDGLMNIAFSPDGALLASAGVEFKVRIWDVATGRLLHTLPHSDELMAVAFSADGSMLASGGYDNQVYLWGIPAPATDIPEADDVVQVPAGPAPAIDGTLSPGEWDAALVTGLLDNDELLLMQADGYLYLALNVQEELLGSLCLDRGDEIAVLHSSAALGTAVYQPTATDWQLIQGFEWRCRSTGSSAQAQTERDQHLQEEGWLASNTNTGSPQFMEYQIALPVEGLRLAVTYLRSPDWNSVFAWPQQLDDGCRQIQLLQGPPPEKLSFNPDQWVTLTAGE